MPDKHLQQKNFSTAPPITKIDPTNDIVSRLLSNFVTFMRQESHDD
jgi:hypothetical protein